MKKGPTNVEPEMSILQFEFEEKVHLYGRITDSENIKFIRDNQKETAVTVTGFEITIKESDEDKIANAIERTAPGLITF
jgi:hypothetical protein